MNSLANLSPQIQMMNGLTQSQPSNRLAPRLLATRLSLERSTRHPLSRIKALPPTYSSQSHIGTSSVTLTAPRTFYTRVLFQRKLPSLRLDHCNEYNWDQVLQPKTSQKP